MKTYGIIAEYNPFHNGHKRHIEIIREQQGATHIAAAMSGNFVQRGDVAVIDKFKRARLAVDNGVDLVVELPVAYSLAAAEYFGRAGVFMLSALMVDGISFGCENNNVKSLVYAADAAINAAKSPLLETLLKKGTPYPAALQEVVTKEQGNYIGGLFNTPNNTLAIEYIKAIKYLQLNMEVLAVKREGAEHDKQGKSANVASGMEIRRMIRRSEDISAFVPPDVNSAVKEYAKNNAIAYFQNLEQAVLYKLRTASLQDIIDTPDTGQGLHNRIFAVGRASNSLAEYFAAVASKRYTDARMRRIILNLLIGVKNVDLLIPPQYGRVLALNERGAEILKKAALNKADNKYAIPFMTSVKRLMKFNNPAINNYIAMSSRASDIYGLASYKNAPCAMEFTAKIEMQ